VADIFLFFFGEDDEGHALHGGDVEDCCVVTALLLKKRNMKPASV
jgi:hypothetical protein